MKFNQFYSFQISAIFHGNIEHHISDFSCSNFSKEVQYVLANQIGFKFALKRITFLKDPQRKYFWQFW
jgi:hypothetical protein